MEEKAKREKLLSRFLNKIWRSGEEKEKKKKKKKKKKRKRETRFLRKGGTWDGSSGDPLIWQILHAAV